MSDPNAALNQQVQQTTQLVNLNDTLLELLKDQQDLMRSINNELSNQQNITKEVRKQYNSLESIADKLVDDHENLLDLSQRQLDKEKLKAETALSRLKTAASQLKTEIASGAKDVTALEGKKKLTSQERILLQAAEEGFKIEEETVRLITERLNLQKRINKDIGIFGAGIKSIENLTRKIGLSGIDDVFKDARKAAEEKAKALIQSDANVSSMKVNLAASAASMKVLAKGIGQALLDPVFLLTAQITILKKGFDLYKGINQTITEQGRQLGISYEESRKIYQTDIDYALSLKDRYATESRIIEGRKALNDALGSALNFSKETSTEAKRLMEFYSMSSEQLEKMLNLSARNGKTFTQTKDTILKTAVTQKAQFGGTLNYQKILQKVNSVSGDILTRFKGNVTELTAAVQQADRLGLTLEQVDKVGESLLNFETSIQNELKAELLTGKALNLERARAAALSGNQRQLMNEIATQVGNIYQFEKLNTIQRQAYAEAFGMTASEMGDMLRKREFEAQFGKIEQENAQKILDSAKARGVTVADNIKKELEQLSMQERMKDVLSRIQSILKRITEGPFKTMGGYIEKALRGVEKMLKAFSAMSGGGLGSALGTMLLAFPSIILLGRLLAGSMRALVLGPRGSSPMNPMFVTMTQALGGMGSRMPGGFVPGLGFTGGTLPGGIRQNAAGRYIGSNGRFVSNATVMAAQQKQGMMGMRNMGIGAGLSVGGMALQGVASSMEPGAGANAVGLLGQTATYAGMGMMFGPWGAAIGGLVGLGVGLFSLSKENEERRKQEQEKEKQQQEATKNLIEQLSMRPVKLTISNKEIGELNVATSQYSANGFFGNQ